MEKDSINQTKAGVMMDIRGFQEKLKIMYEFYKDTVEEGYKVLSYEEWLELKLYNSFEENKSLAIKTVKNSECL